MAVLQVEWLPPVMGPGNQWIWLVTLAIGVVLGATHRRLPGIDHRLCRRSLLHRHAGRAAGVAGICLADRQRPDHRPDGRHFPAPRRWIQRVARGDGKLDRRRSRLCRDHCPPRHGSASSSQVRLSPSPHVARRRSRCPGLRGGARRGVGDEQLLLAGEPGHPVRRGEQHPDSRRRPSDPARDPLSGSHPGRSRPRHELCHEPASLRAICLLHRRESRGRQPGRDQDQAHHRQSLHDHGHPRGHLRRRLHRPSQRRGERSRHA